MISDGEVLRHLAAVQTAVGSLHRAEAVAFALAVADGLVPLYDHHAVGVYIPDPSALRTIIANGWRGEWPAEPMHAVCVPPDPTSGGVSLGWTVCFYVANSICDLTEAIKLYPTDIHYIASRALDVLDSFEDVIDEHELEALARREMARQIALLRLLSRGECDVGFAMPELLRRG